MRIALALSAVLVAVGIACGGGAGLPSEQLEPGAGGALTIASQIPEHTWRVTIEGCSGSLRILSGLPQQSLWGCASEDRAAHPWPMFAGSAKLAADGQSIILGDNDVSPAQGYPVPRNAAQLAPDGVLTGSFTDANHFTGTITGWGAPIAVTLELARE